VRLPRSHFSHTVEFRVSNPTKNEKTVDTTTFGGASSKTYLTYEEVIKKYNIKSGESVVFEYGVFDPCGIEHGNSEFFEYELVGNEF